MVVTLPAADGEYHRLSRIICSYSSAPQTAKMLTAVLEGGPTFQAYISTACPPPIELCLADRSPNRECTITLPAGGEAIAGTVYVEYV